MDLNSNTIVLGVDVGGSHITSALINIKEGTIIENSVRREHVNAYGEAKEIIETWVLVMKESLITHSNSGIIKIAMPGPFNYSEGISLIRGLGKYDMLFNLNIREMLKDALNGLATDIHFFNDAACFLKGEIVHGVAKGYKSALGFTLGTGFGSAICHNGKVSDAAYWKYPFMSSCCENYFSSKWFTKRYNEIANNNINNVKELLDCSNDANSLLQVFDEFSLNIGLFIANIYNTNLFECIVFGGNISNAFHLFMPQLEAYLKMRSLNINLLVSKRGENAALIGATAF